MSSGTHKKMLPEQILLNYGILGLWTVYLLMKEKNFNQQIKQTIENNTLALNKVSFFLEKLKIK